MINLREFFLLNLPKNLIKKKEEKIKLLNNQLVTSRLINPANATIIYLNSRASKLKQISLQGIILTLLTVATVLVYSNIGNSEFVIYDDPVYVSANSFIKDGLTLRNIAWAFTSGHCSNWHPITWLSHMLDIELFDLNAGYHHLMNLFIHICNSLLLYILFLKATGEIYKSFFLAAFFALHPLHVESVAWIAERKDLLCAFFWITAMLAHYRYTQRPSPSRYLLTFFCFIFGSLSKSMMVTFPFALLLFDYWPLNRHVRFDSISDPWFKKKSWVWLAIEKVPMILISIAISYIAMLTQSKGGSISYIPFPMRIANALVSYIVYLKKMLWPGDLSVLYPLTMPSLWLAAVSFTLIVVGLILAFVLRHRFGYLLFGLLWYLGTLVPVIGIIQVGSQSMADRYTYIPSIGIFAAIIWGVSKVFSHITSDKIFNKIIISVVSTTILILMMLLSSIQVRYWQNSITLMSNAVHVTKNNLIAHENLGLALIDEGLYEEGLYHFKRAIRINPGFAEAYMNIGSYHQLRGDYNVAIEFYQKAITLDQGLDKAYALMGMAQKAKDKLIEAQINLKKAHKINSADINLKNEEFN